MQHGSGYQDEQSDAYDKRAIAAIFDTLDEAKEAVHDLHDAGLHGTWVGVTAISDDYDDPDSPTTSSYVGAGRSDRAENALSENTVRTAEGGGFGASIARFFGEENKRPLVEALMSRGIPQRDALALDGRMHDGGAILTVDVGDDYDLAMQILRNDGGVLTGREDRAVGKRPISDIGSAPGVLGVSLGERSIEDEKTLQLREERLLIDKERVSAGEATLQKRVVSERQSIDVPVSHDELFISRRPVTGAASVSGPIGKDETIEIPLMRDHVVVDKRAYVTEEVRYGKRSVAGTARVEGDVRHEELVVDDQKARDARGLE